MLNLTTEEHKVLIFLMGIVLLGIGISYASKLFLPVRMIASLDENLGKIDLNSADKELLKTIPGVGERLAQRIIELRTEKAGLSDLDELKEIKGITSRQLNRMKNYLILR